MKTYLTTMAQHFMSLGVLIGILLSYPTVLVADDPSFPEAKIKAALIYNFMRFVDWPEESDRTGVICVIGPKHEYRQALEFLTTQPLKKTNITLQEINNGNGADVLSKCQIVFMTNLATEKQKQRLFDKETESFLIVEEDAHFADHNAMINLIARNQKIGFEVNLMNAKQANFRISSKVLRLADRVIQ